MQVISNSILFAGKFSGMQWHLFNAGEFTDTHNVEFIRILSFLSMLNKAHCQTLRQYHIVLNKMPYLLFFFVFYSFYFFTVDLQIVKN